MYFLTNQYKHYAAEGRNEKQENGSSEKENMKCDEALRLAKINAESDDRMIWSCASKLRNDIFAVQSKQISHVINSTQLIIT